ncbi:hypothetical protein [Tropicimonas sp. IMCC34043]|uniref:hypothetical protein n=1 Tax=Tropicimonas sp. IMCC34043 TaxID=2248760 RepID=UPI0013008C1D|nr:hypothetical protein [Tropicimonas sp. IMCC34043]
MKHDDFIRDGVIGPAGNKALDSGISRNLPEGVPSNHARRVRPGGVVPTHDSLVRMGMNTVSVACSLERFCPPAMLCGCTGSRFVQVPAEVDSVSGPIEVEVGVAADHHLAQRPRRAEGAPGLPRRSLGPRNPPVDDNRPRQLQREGSSPSFTRRHGPRPDRCRGLAANHRFGTRPPGAGEGLRRGFDRRHNPLTFIIIAELETLLGGPVKSSNLALLWAALPDLVRLPASCGGQRSFSLLSLEPVQLAGASTKQPAKS